MTTVLKRFTSDESGATAIEYALIMVMVAMGIIISLTDLKDGLNAALDLASSGLDN